MGFFDLFRRAPPIRDLNALAEFIDQRAAFVAQKGIYEYARARSGHYSKVLFRELEFQAACDIARWQTFPLGLAMVGELAEGVVSSARPGERAAVSEAMRKVILELFDRYPVPAALGAARWAQLREDLDQHLKQMSLHPPKWAKDIPEPFWQRYFDLMPIHEKMRTKDELTTRNYLRVTMINIHDELTKRIDASAVAADLVARG
jgi:hypothetical protein